MEDERIQRGKEDIQLAGGAEGGKDDSIKNLDYKSVWENSA